MSSDNTAEAIREQYRRAANVLRNGGVVALPTDTVFGLCAVASDASAVERVYEIKARDPSQPMPLFVASTEQAGLIADMPETARLLAAKFWPGALTLVLRKKTSFQTRAAASGDTVGVRMPDDPFLLEAAAQLGPLTGTSANIAGREECHTAAEVRAQLGDAIDLVVDGPVTATGRPSTIVDCTDDRQPPILRILREGALSREAIADPLAGSARLI
ncbi:MAG: L-threonylcarbamoyladenylate synthase [Chloroflexota bacterium]|nr:L-threonylcarbamoyladenylate synthase [Chloroflexota bacterium]